MGLAFPPRQRPPWYYYPIFSTTLMLASIITICVWIHYTQVMIFSILAALEVLGNGTAADNFTVLSQAVIATSVLFIIYACVIYGLCLWRNLLEAEIDSQGVVRDKLQLYMMANLGTRICWMIIVTWIVFLLAGCAVFSVYVSNAMYLIQETLKNQQQVGGGPPLIGAYPDCPATCVDLWVVDYIDVPRSNGCVCDPDTLTSCLSYLDDANAAAPGCFTGAVLMYIVGGFWRSELSKDHAATRKEQDVARRLQVAGVHIPVKGGFEAGAGARNGSSGAASAGYRPLSRGGGGPRGSRGGSRGGGVRGRGRTDVV